MTSHEENLLWIFAALNFKHQVVGVSVWHLHTVKVELKYNCLPSCLHSSHHLSILCGDCSHWDSFICIVIVLDASVH